MDCTVYIVYAWAILIAVIEAKAFQTYNFRKEETIVESVCAENYRVFNRVGVPSSVLCASICTKTTGCDAFYFSAFNGTCTGCRKTLANPSPTSTANEYYKLVNENIREWSNGTSRYLLDLYRPMNFADAKVYCQQFGAHVVVPDNQVEQDIVAFYLSRAAGGRSSWIGISDTNNGAPFLIEHSGEVANYTSMYPGEPNDYGMTESCVTFDRGRQFYWIDLNCDSNVHVVCEHG